MVVRALPNVGAGREYGALLVELTVALAILGTVVIAMSYGVGLETRALAACYTRAVAMEIVDGEMEVLLAGSWRDWSDGEHAYPVDAEAATNLPEGRFVLRRGDGSLRLEWRPEKAASGGSVVREARLP